MSHSVEHAIQANIANGLTVKFITDLYQSEIKIKNKHYFFGIYFFRIYLEQDIFKDI